MPLWLRMITEAAGRSASPPFDTRSAKPGFRLTRARRAACPFADDGLPVRIRHNPATVSLVVVVGGPQARPAWREFDCATRILILIACLPWPAISSALDGKSTDRLQRSRRPYDGWSGHPVLGDGQTPHRQRPRCAPVRAQAQRT